MADELNETAEFGRKHKNEEEPILVAQRFLNIYRQMHIFNRERREQFDDMLLDMPPDIRILLSTLPGGSLLIEHIEELEKKRGLIPLPTQKAKPQVNKKNEKDNSETKSAKQAAGGTVVIDASFASELSSSLSLALQQTERRYKEDIKTLTETLTQSITQSQTAIGDMIKDILLTAQKNMTVDSKPQVIVVPADYSASISQKTAAAHMADDELPVITKDMITNQQKEKAVQKNESVAEASNSLKTENPAVDNQTPAQNPAIESEKPLSIDKAEVKIDKQSSDKAQTEPETEVRADTDNSSGNMTENSATPSKKKKKKKNKKNKNSLQETAETATAPIVSDIAASAETEIQNSIENIEENPTSGPQQNQESFDENDIDNFDISDLQDTLKSEDNNPEEFSIDDILPAENSDDSFDFENLPTDDNLEVSPYENELDRIRLALEEPEDNQTDEVSISTVLPQEEPLQPMPEESSDKKPAAEPQKPAEDLQQIAPINTVESEPVSLDDIAFEPVSLDDFDNLVPPDYTAPAKTEETANQKNVLPQNSDNNEWTFVEQSDSANSAENWEWEYVDESAENPSAQDDNWEWEYVEDDGSDESDWEWEYVEDDGSDESDWEWEYVEDDGSDTNSAK